MANARSRDWLFGPGPDLLLGCGGGYLLVFGLLALQGPTIRAWLPLALIPLLVNSLLLPHYGATLIRVYENRSDRRAYAFGAVWMTLLLAGVFIASLHSVLLGSFTRGSGWSGSRSMARRRSGITLRVRSAATRSGSCRSGFRPDRATPPSSCPASRTSAQPRAQWHCCCGAPRGAS